MNYSNEKREIDDIQKIKQFLGGLGFVCNSFPSAQHLIYSKNMDIVIIKNNETKEK